VSTALRFDYTPPDLSGRGAKEEIVDLVCGARSLRVFGSAPYAGLFSSDEAASKWNPLHGRARDGAVVGLHQ
jgi:hypothetical protein